MAYKVLFLGERSPRHQQASRAAAPPSLTLTFLSHRDRENILHELADTEYLISERAGAIDAALIAAAPQLKLIQRLGSLTYDIDLVAAQAAGIQVYATPVDGCIFVAEHLLLQMLALVKHLPEVSAIARAAGDWAESKRTDENVFAYNWSKRRGIGTLMHKTIGIIGFGEIGVELARLLTPIRLSKVLYHKRTRLPASVETELGITYAEPAQIYRESDLLCSLLPYSASSDGLLNAAVFAQMKAGSLLVHCGSGSVIDEVALAAAIRSGHIGGAALDTFEWEPLRADNPLVALARSFTFNVLLTPHTAAGTADQHEVTRRDDFANIMHHIEGQVERKSER